MERKIKLAVVMAGALALCAGQGAMAEWHGSIGLGLSSLALDGDIGFDTPGGPLGPADVDLSNSDTADMGGGTDKGCSLLPSGEHTCRTRW